MPAEPPPPLELTWVEVFGEGDTGEEPFLKIHDWSPPIRFFVGRNGSGKTRAARALSLRLGARFLSTDRLVGLMAYTNYGWTVVPDPGSQRGLPLGDQERQLARSIMASGTGVDDLYAIREQPEVWLRVAAFIRRALGRDVQLQERAGYLDPFVRIGSTQYSLLRDEGHGLRELVLLLAATYRDDWSVLIVDEPELHLHPLPRSALAR